MEAYVVGLYRFENFSTQYFYVIQVKQKVGLSALNLPLIALLLLNAIKQGCLVQRIRRIRRIVLTFIYPYDNSLHTYYTNAFFIILAFSGNFPPSNDYSELSMPLNSIFMTRVVHRITKLFG
jgi:hypothetical protein